jgi:hypothetical protein
MRVSEQPPKRTPCLDPREMRKRLDVKQRDARKAGALSGHPAFGL